VVNVLTQQADILEVCDEETIEEIRTRQIINSNLSYLSSHYRYLEYNAHALCYTWKQLKNDTFVKMDMSKTLAQSGINDEGMAFEHMGIDEDQFMPVVHVYFNDDLTCG